MQPCFRSAASIRIFEMRIYCTLKASSTPITPYHFRPLHSSLENHSRLAMTFVSLKQLAFLALTTGATTVNAQSGSGRTTRYWDCCKGSCGWSGKASVNQPIRSCDKSDNPLANMAAKNACENGGVAYMCSNQSPWAVDDNTAYGFAAVKLSGGTESSWCCACYE